jgi:hypothetical protein
MEEIPSWVSYEMLIATVNDRIGFPRDVDEETYYFDLMYELRLLDEKMRSERMEQSKLRETTRKKYDFRAGP